jgi:hypothetical protein
MDEQTRTPRADLCTRAGRVTQLTKRGSAGTRSDQAPEARPDLAPEMPDNDSVRLAADEIVGIGVCGAQRGGAASEQRGCSLRELAYGCGR